MKREKIPFLCDLLLKIFFLFISVSSSWAIQYKHMDDSRDVEFFQKIVSNKKGLFFEGITWVKGNQMCVEFEKDDNLYTSLIRGQDIYEFSSDSSNGIMRKLNSKSSGVIFSSDLFSSKKRLKDFLDKMNAVYLKDEIYENEFCSVYQYEIFQKEEKIIHTLWIWKKVFFPLRVEIIFQNEEKISIFYDNIIINSDIPEKRFFIPKRVQFKRVKN